MIFYAKTIAESGLPSRQRNRDNIRFTESIPMSSYMEIVESDKSQESNTFKSEPQDEIIEDSMTTSEELEQVSVSNATDVNINVGSDRIIKFSCPKCSTKMSTQLNKLIVHKHFPCPSCKGIINSEDILKDVIED